MDASGLINAAAKAIGYLGPGRSLSNSEATDALLVLNGMIDSWRSQSLFVYTVSSATYVLTPSQYYYTIGPSGADFTADRPTRIVSANIVLTSSTPNVHVPLQILDDQEWASLRVREIPTTLPTKLYNDGAYPNSSLYLWGYPSAANSLELWTWKQLAVISSLATTVALPPGYQDALMYSLAERLAIQWGRPIPQSVEVLAGKARAFIKAANSQAPKLVTLDSGMPAGRRPYFNYMTGGF